MQLGMIGLGRMGASMVRRLIKGGHECIVYDLNPEAVKQLEDSGATGAKSIDEFVSKLATPRVIWLMVPAAFVDQELKTLSPLLQMEDIIIDGGNSYYRDDILRGKAMAKLGIHYVDAGTSGGVAGLERGYCLMIGGEKQIVEHLTPIFATLAPGVAAAPRTPGKAAQAGTAEQGFLHCGPQGAGHFVKMVHNGIEYGLMAAYAEGLNILRHANAGKQQVTADAETSPMRDPEYYQYDLNMAEITELWRRGSVIGSWLLDLMAEAFTQDPELKDFTGRVSDSGEGRWTVEAAIDEGVPASVISTALFERFESRNNGEFGNQVLSALRKQFGGHDEKKKE